MRIITPEQSRFDLSCLDDVGQIVYLFDGEHARPGIWNEPAIYERVYERLTELAFDPAVDAFLAAGNVVLQSFALLTIGREFGCCRLLLHDASRDAFRQVVWPHGGGA